MYRFDEFDPECRSPAGALPLGRPLEITMRYARGRCKNIALLWRADDGELNEQKMDWLGAIGRDDVYSARIIAPDRGLYWYWFGLETEDGSFVIDRSGPRDGPETPYQLTVYDKDLKTPDWIKGGVMYHIFVDRYAKGGRRERFVKPGTILRDDWGGIPSFLPDDEGIVKNNDFFGGNLEGIVDKLPHLRDMGVTCLYLSPIFEADSSHKYDTNDYLNIDPGFGDDKIFRKLCKEAAAHGMKVVLDGVFSHVGMNSRYFNKSGHYDGQGAYQSKDSQYYRWFMFKDWPDEYESWWGIQLLPAIDKNDSSYREFITAEGGVVDKWTGCGAGGWRLDVADELPDIFLDPLCEAARRKNPETLIIGEVWEDASNKIAYGVRRRYLLGGQLDSVMNYPLKDAIIAYIREKNTDILADTLSDITQNYPKPVLDSLMNILGTHDTMRILTVLGGDRFPETKTEMSCYRLSEEQRSFGRQMLKIAAALQFTLPGFPCVYYGDEAGMEGGADPFNRVGYPWGAEDAELIQWYKRLAEIRRSTPVFRDGIYRLLAAKEGVFAFTRGEGDGAVLVAANIGEEDMLLPGDEFCFDLIGNKPASACVAYAKTAAIYTKGRIQR
ncbi:MAG: glycoside hydrolase family 13 protein [Oscillospiraceae bacterium]|nr:glycoside hydrolase family 13 protein [Oscillospiraceae bacterium]